MSGAVKELAERIGAVKQRAQKPLTCPFSHAALNARSGRPINQDTYLREESASRTCAVECLGCGARGPWASNCLEAITLWNNLSPLRRESE